MVFKRLFALDVNVPSRRPGYDVWVDVVLDVESRNEYYLSFYLYGTSDALVPRLKKFDQERIDDWVRMCVEEFSRRSSKKLDEDARYGRDR